jgi:hypothetical protein
MALRDPGQDLSALLNRAQQDTSANLRGEDLRAIMGPSDPMAHESFDSAARLCNEAIQAALKHRGIWDRRRTAKTRSRLMVFYANAYISSWSRDRGMDQDEVARLQAKGGVS